jgi:hypothetical protein
MNEHGICLAADVTPKTQGEHQQQKLREIDKHLILHRRNPVRVIYVDDSGKFTEGCVSRRSQLLSSAYQCV